MLILLLDAALLGGITLQYEKKQPEDLRRRLGIGNGKKILLVPLQRPTDTVIEYFCGAIGSYENFIRLIQSLAIALSEHWEIVVKKHPLEIETPNIKGVYYANDENIKSLIELSDAILLINSGVGVLGMMYSKPVFVAGNAFYSHDGLTCGVSNVEDVLEAIHTWRPDQEKILRFISYLVNDFYSFGKFSTRIVKWHDGSNMSATTNIEYYTVRFPNTDEMNLEGSKFPIIDGTSLLFDRYRNIHGQIRMRNEKKPQSAQGYSIERNSKSLSAAPVRAKSVITKKLNKLKKSPKLFFQDSKNPLMNLIGRVIK